LKIFSIFGKIRKITSERALITTIPEKGQSEEQTRYDKTSD
jgi:hypothetical protein